MSEFDSIFDQIIDLTAKIEDGKTISILMRAANSIVLADQQYSLGEAKGVNLSALGVTDDRRQGRRSTDIDYKPQ